MTGQDRLTQSLFYNEMLIASWKELGIIPKVKNRRAVWVQNGCTGCSSWWSRGWVGDAVTIQHHERVFDCLAPDQEKTKIQHSKYGFYWSTSLLHHHKVRKQKVNRNSISQGPSKCRIEEESYYTLLGSLLSSLNSALQTSLQVILCKSKLFLKAVKCLTVWINHISVN